MTGDLNRPVPVARIGSSGLTVSVRAADDECSGLAERMGLPAIASLACDFDLVWERGGVSIAAKGTLRATVTRVCVISAEEFEAGIEEHFSVRFVPAGTERDDPDPDLDDEIPFSGETIDLGEAAAEQLALALEPYPRMPGAEWPEIEDDGAGSPFSVLRGSRGGSNP